MSIKKQNLARHGGSHLQSQLLGRKKQEHHKFNASLGKVSKPISQNQNKNKRARSIVQTIECLPTSARPWIQSSVPQKGNLILVQIPPN
jgi:hypothetical protein